MSQEQKPNLRNLGAAIAKNHFNGVPVEFIVPPGTPVVFVSDMFAQDYSGGAELTTEAIIKKSPHRVFKVHSQSLTVDMLEKYQDRYWIICNFTQADVAALAYLAQSKIKYSIVEYDYKYCIFRSEVMHQKQTGHSCDCPLRPHGILVEKLYSGAQHIFWMSEKQKEQFVSKIPSLIFAPDGKHIVQGSVFDDQTLDKLVSLREVHAKAVSNIPIKIWGVQGSQNWIKGTQETIKWCTEKKLPVKVLGNMAYETFLAELASCHGLVFQPLDFDTCPRIVIEAKIMGCELELNNNVQHKDELWFTKSSDEIVSHLKTRGEYFWSHISL
jgi:hypothetical protein